MSQALKVVVMGVSGCGKSTVGRLLAEQLQVPFIEGDELHPPRNVALMAAGTPLSDEDRAGWLDTVATRLSQSQSGAVVSCSALKRRYRDRLRAAAPGLRLVFLSGSRELIASRLGQRKGHYMPASLLDSQFATLEPPGPDEAALCLDVKPDPKVLALQAARSLQAPASVAANPKEHCS